MRGCCNGSQAGLRCQCPQGRGGSIPLPRTSSNLFGIKNMERFCGSQNRALIFAKTISAVGERESQCANFALQNSLLFLILKMSLLVL